jgi:hypothetical protein
MFRTLSINLRPNLPARRVIALLGPLFLFCCLLVNPLIAFDREARGAEEGYFASTIPMEVDSLNAQQNLFDYIKQKKSSNDSIVVDQTDKNSICLEKYYFINTSCGPVPYRYDNRHAFFSLYLPPPSGLLLS